MLLSRDKNKAGGRVVLPWVGAAGVLGLSRLLPIFWPGLKKQLFCLPAARVTSWFLNAPIETADNGAPVLLFSDRSLEIAEQCGGFDFFTISAAVLFWLALRRRGSVMRLPVILPLAYVVTIVANSVRVTALAWFVPIGKIMFPDNWQAAVHLGIGIGVFLPCLLLLTFLTERTSYVIDRRQS